MQELHHEGWLLANLERKRGGLGYGLYGDDPLAFFLLDEHLTHGNPSTAHCFQVHNNTLMMINQVGSEEQVARWIEPTVKRGALLPGCGAEPQGVPPSRQHGPRAGFW
jgi:alkylation response protein AidB-like acyl-CoA dehydrogenase